MNRSEMIRMRKELASKYELFSLSDGNKKLVPDKEVKFLIWNIPAVKTCPFATEACKIACYAKTAETVYPEVLPSRTRNFEASKRSDFVERMIATIRYMMLAPSYANAKEVRFRIHESGDFYNQTYVNAWLEIAKAVKDIRNLVFLAYTKSFKYFDGVKLPSNFQLLASIWSDTKKSQLDIVMKNGWRIYTAIPENMIETSKEYGFTECTCENCNTCKTDCYHKGNDLIAVRLHGTEGKKIATTISEDRIMDLLKRHGVIK